MNPLSGQARALSIAVAGYALLSTLASYIQVVDECDDINKSLFLIPVISHPR